MIILALLHACPAYLPASRSVARPALLPRARLARCCDGPEPGDEPVEVILPEVIEATEVADAAASDAQALTQEVAALTQELATVYEAKRVRDEAFDDLLAEIDAVRILADEEVAAAMAEVGELREALQRAEAAGGYPPTNGSGGAEAQLAALRPQLAALERDRNEGWARAEAAEMDVQNLQQEMEAVRVLADELVAEARDQVEAARQEASDALERARRAAPARGEDDASRTAELENQVEELLWLVESQQDVQDELLIARPKAARAEALERELALARRRLRELGVDDFEELGDDEGLG